MAEETKRTLEMRVAELEDKLSKIHITEDEMKAYQKVSGLLGTGASAAAPCIAAQAAPCIAAHNAAPCIASQAAPCIAAGVENALGCWTECWAPIRQCIRMCWIFQPGTGSRFGGGGVSGGGFGSLGG
jgi:hypothetical protein